MNYILAIESATKVCSVAIYQNFGLLDAIEYNGDYSHAEKLAVFVNDILEKHNIQATELSAIAISKGPGSYTGLRIGVALAKGMCYSLSIPLIAISTLEALAFRAKESFKINAGIIVPMIDARRMEVYKAVYDGELKTLEKVQATILDEKSLENHLSQSNVYCVGDGAEKIENVVKHSRLIVHSDCLPSARFFGPQIENKFKSASFENLAYFEPYYLKDFIAVKSKPLI